MNLFKRAAIVGSGLLPIMWLSLPALAADPTATAKADEDEGMRLVDVVSIGLPIAKVAFHSDKTELQPNFVPGPSLGHLWKNGFGVFFYPTMSFQSKPADYLLAPHVSVHYLIFCAGIGYEWRWRQNNGGDVDLFSRAPIFTLGVGIPLKLLRKL